MLHAQCFIWGSASCPKGIWTEVNRRSCNWWMKTCAVSVLERATDQEHSNTCLLKKFNELTDIKQVNAHFIDNILKLPYEDEDKHTNMKTAAFCCLIFGLSFTFLLQDKLSTL